MLAYVAGSFSTDLNVWERIAGPCVSQEVCHSTTTVSVVWLRLGAGFRVHLYSMYKFPCPGISMLDVVQTGGLLDRSRTGAFDFSRLFKCGSLATCRVEKRPYDDVTGHLKVDNALHPSFLPAECCRPFKSCRSGRTQEWRLGYEMSGGSTASNPSTSVDS